jgi:6-pyruvoyltetrahydropterin/6-carboxytetrahydropterin synthase
MEKENIPDKKFLELSIELRFNAAHNYFIEDWDENKNKQVFGDNYSKNPHGHNYKLVVKVRGELNNKTGMVINFHKLEDLIYENVIKELDKKYLNKEVEHFKKKLPTLENIVIYAGDKLKMLLREFELTEVQLYEDDYVYACVKYKD